MTALSILFAIVTLAAAVYVQWAIPRFTAGTRSVWLTRALLLVVGAGLGYVYSQAAPQTPVLAFAAAFGAVHVPAAFIS